MKVEKFHKTKTERKELQKLRAKRKKFVDRISKKKGNENPYFKQIKRIPGEKRDKSMFKINFNQNLTPEELKQIREKNLKRDEEDGPKTIFVGNLETSIKKQHINSLFKEFGKIKSIRLRTIDGKKFLAKQQITGCPSLNAYVVFEDEESAKNALSLSGKKFKSTHIRVSLAKKIETDTNTGQGRTIFVGNLKKTVTDEILYNFFEPCGDIEYVRTLRNEKGCSGVGYVCFKNKDSVQLAIDLKGTELENRPINIEHYVKDYKTKIKSQNKENPKHKLKKKDKKMKKIPEKIQKKKKNNENEKDDLKDFKGVKSKIKKKNKLKKGEIVKKTLANKLRAKHSKRKQES